MQFIHPPLTKTLDPKDEDTYLATVMPIVDRHFTAASPQHEQRRWEYAMALLATSAWRLERPLVNSYPSVAFDVGGAGSPFHLMLADWGVTCHVIDPKEGMSLQETVEGRPELKVELVYCISTLEHIPRGQTGEFIRALAQVVAPGGMLFLTTDYWNRRLSDPDTAHFNWMRERIFQDDSWRALGRIFQKKGFEFLGEVDPVYHGDQVYDYTFACMTLKKRERNADYLPSV